MTRAEGQWLALDPFGSAHGTLGATIATGSAGPLAHAFGTPRDNVLGIEAVTGTGEIVRAGGRVVKNVAGFDLTRLFTGAWGTLAVITEATVRLRALPERDQTIALALSLRATRWRGGSRSCARFPSLRSRSSCSTLRSRARSASAIARCFSARLGGNDDSVREQLRAIGTLGEMRPAPQSCVERARGDRAGRRRSGARVRATFAAARAVGAALRV